MSEMQRNQDEPKRDDTVAEEKDSKLVSETTEKEVSNSGDATDKKTEDRDSVHRPSNGNEAEEIIEAPVDNSHSAQDTPSDRKVADDRKENEDDSHSDEISDEELEKEDEHEEISSDEEEEDEYAQEELELPDYSQYPPEKLVHEAEKLLKNEPVQKLREHFESIRKHLLSDLNEEKKEKLNEFLEAGGTEIDFEYIQPLRESFKKIYGEYRKKRQAYYQDLEEKLNNNLRIKESLIEKLKEIVSKDESIGDTFKEFNAIQQEWRNTGPVPRTESADLWRTYHHHVENFYEYIKINKELRDLDFRKNHEAKEQLIQQAEKLTEEQDIRQAFSRLQKLHKEWKRLGPVEREHREPMWERFSEATRKIHEKREEYYNKLKGRREELIAEKKKLVKQLQDFPFEKLHTHTKWQEAIRAVDALREEFKRIGRIQHPENDIIWQNFREVLKDFNHKKNQFYKELKREQYENLNKKRELLAIAEELKDSSEWKTATNEMKRIQAEWKKIGHVPRSESDKIWKKFRAACNHYFDRLTEHNREQDNQLEGNYKTKEQLLKDVESFQVTKDQKQTVADLKQLINRWKAIGPVPRNKRNIEAEFNRVLDKHFKSIDLDRQESQRIRFENRMESMLDQGGDRKLENERNFLRQKLDEANKELSQLETNMSFFTTSDPNSLFIREAQKKIEQQKSSIADLEDKIKMMNVKIREVNKQEGDG